MRKPDDLFDRDREWADLSEFVTSAGAGLRLGVVYGRRRQGKSFLLRRLAAQTGGLYVLPLEEARTPALTRFGEAVAEGLLGLSPDGIRFDSWEAVLSAAVAALPRTARRSGTPAVLVIDELPYLLAHSPEIPSVLQRLYDESRQLSGAPPVRIIVCGSALSVMSDLLSGSRALRGRVMVDMCLRPFTYREAQTFWGIDDLDLGLHVHAVFGGTPGYRDLVAAAPPSRVGGLGTWLAKSVLNPAHALFGEADYLLREDPRLTDRATYNSILTAIAAGARTPTKIGGFVGRPAQSLAHPMTVLQTAGFVDRTEDVLLQRRPLLELADPIVRFHELITAPRLALLEERRAREAWASAADTFASNIIGPHFEHLCRVWTARYGRSEGLRSPVGAVGPTVVNDPAGRSLHEVDVVGLAEGQAAQAREPRVVVLGEAKHSVRPRTVADLSRLEHVRQLLVDRGIDAANAQLVLFTRTAPDRQLSHAASGRADVLLVDLAALYGRP